MQMGRMRKGPALVLGVLGLLVWAGCDSGVSVEDPEPRTGRGATLSAVQQTEWSAARLNDMFRASGIPAVARYGLRVHTVVYETIDPQGQTTQASGALFVPVDAPEALPLLSYQHGTLTTDAEAPSEGGFEQIIGLIYASDGYVVAMPDLLGLGASPGFHPYVHAASSATAVVDMLRASVDFVRDADAALNGQLFLTGYSQGGYTAMAAHRALEADHAGEFTVTASAPMAGPYDLSGTMAETFLQPEPHPSPYYLPYLLLAYDDVYGLFADPSEMLAAPYDETIPPLFDRQTAGGTINDALPSVALDFLAPTLVEAFQADPTYPLRQRLRENDLYDWTPRAPVRLYHCAADQHVPAENSAVAFERLQQRGADVQLIDPFPEGNHGTCFAPALLASKFWFDELSTAAPAR